MQPVGSATLASQFEAARLSQSEQKPSDKQLEFKQTFQDFVAGTFFKQMLQSLRDTTGEPAYMHGGQAERIFQGQMDQQVAEDLAKNQGAPFSDALFYAFKNRLNSPSISAVSGDKSNASAALEPT